MKTLGLALFGMTLATGAQAITIVNGSFELPGTYSGPFTTLSAGSTALTGWDIDSGSIDLINTLWQNSDGFYSIDMDGNAPATISQQLNGLVVGQTYSILFDMAANVGGPDDFKTMTVAAGLDAQRYVFDGTGKSHANMGWETNQFDFVATATSEKLEFMSTSLSGAYGPALDNVRLAPIPLPAGGLLLVTGLGAMALRRRR